MTYLIPIALLGWIPVSLVLFAILPGQRAAVTCVIAGWLLLPPASLPISGLPDYDKPSATAIGVLLATLIFQPNRLLGFRPRWVDLPILCFCLCPLASSLANGLGVYDGISAALGQTFHWGFIYLIGRLYLNDLRGFRELTVAMVVAGLLYVLPTIFEIRMSPMLRGMIYGIGGWTGIKFGGYCPFVFLANGLEHGMWMTCASMTAVWLWRCGALRQLGPFPMGSVLLPCLLITTILCRSTGALLLLLTGLVLLWLSTRLNTKFFLYALLLVSPTYYVLRIPNLWSGTQLVSFIESTLSAQRAESLNFRFTCENKLTVRALEQPIWGWGGWGRSRIIGPDGRDLAPTDGMWIIYFGLQGFVGLLSWSTAQLLPTFLFLRRFSVRQWTTPTIGPLAVLAVLLALYQVDCLVNGFINPILIMASGGLICVRPPQPVYQGYTAVTGIDPLAWNESDDQDLAMDAQTEDAAELNDGRLLAISSPQTCLADRYEKLARTLRNEGSLAQAKAAWAHALKLLNELSLANPDVAAIQQRRWECTNDFAWFLANAPEPTIADPLLAVDLATQATGANPDTPTYWNTLGAACCHAGDPAGAIKAIERSIALTRGGTAYDHLLLSLAHARLNQQDQARYWNVEAERWLAQYGVRDPELLRIQEEALSCLDIQPGSPETRV